MANKQKTSEELRGCAHCGSMAVKNGYYAKVQYYGCGNGGCPLKVVAATREQWNRRYVCPDKNGKAVYSNSIITGSWGGLVVGECDLHFEGFQWWAVDYEATYGVRNSYPLSSLDEIELIREGGE